MSLFLKKQKTLKCLNTKKDKRMRKREIQHLEMEAPSQVRSVENQETGLRWEKSDGGDKPQISSLK